MNTLAKFTNYDLFNLSVRSSKSVRLPSKTARLGVPLNEKGSDNPKQIIGNAGQTV